jgi:F0F1-type ATP synthase delta subunit
VKNKKKLLQIAKVMYKQSLKGGSVDASLVQKVLKTATSSPWPNLVKILKIYKNFISIALEKEELLVESATPIAKSYEKELLLKTGAKRIKYEKNPNNIAGVKITHGDWIYDATIDAKLKQLTNESI